MKTSRITCVLKILTGLFLIKQRIKTESAFAGVVCSVFPAGTRRPGDVS